MSVHKDSENLQEQNDTYPNHYFESSPYNMQSGNKLKSKNSFFRPRPAQADTPNMQHGKQKAIKKPPFEVNLTGMS